MRDTIYRTTLGRCNSIAVAIAIAIGIGWKRRVRARRSAEAEEVDDLGAVGVDDFDTLAGGEGDGDAGARGDGVFDVWFVGHVGSSVCGVGMRCRIEVRFVFM